MAADLSIRRRSFFAAGYASPGGFIIGFRAGAEMQYKISLPYSNKKRPLRVVFVLMIILL